MRTKNILGFLAVSAFAIKGGYAVYQYYKNRRDWNDTLGSVGKDAMDGISNIVEIFLDDDREIALCNVTTEVAKGGIELVTEVERWQRNE